MVYAFVLGVLGFWVFWVAICGPIWLVGAVSDLDDWCNKHKACITKVFVFSVSLFILTASAMSVMNFAVTAYPKAQAQNQVPLVA